MKKKIFDRNDPDNIALWKLLYKYEEAPTNATGSSVVGTGDDDEVWKKKKKKSKIVRRLKGTYEVGKPPDPELRRNNEMKEDTDNIAPDSTFASMPVFKIGQDDFAKCQDGKKKHAHWNKHIDTKADYGKKIHAYAKKNPKKSIIVQNDKTGHMVYLKKYSQLEK